MASATAADSDDPRRRWFDTIRPTRPSAWSAATTRAPAPASAVALPPGAAQQVEDPLARAGVDGGDHRLRGRILDVAVVAHVCGGRPVHGPQRLGGRVGAQPVAAVRRRSSRATLASVARSGQTMPAATSSATRRSTALTRPRAGRGEAPTVALTAAWAGDAGEGELVGAQAQRGGDPAGDGRRDGGGRPGGRTPAACGWCRRRGRSRSAGLGHPATNRPSTALVTRLA